MLARWVDGVHRRAIPVSVVILLVTALLIPYTTCHLGINSDYVSVMSESLPSRKAYQEFSSLFPNLDNAMLVVVNGDTPELTRQAADALEASLARQTERFTDVYQPLAGEFFERNGLLYLALEDLDRFAEHMTRLQPVLAELEREASLRQLTEIIEFALEEVHRQGDDEQQWAQVLDGVQQAAVNSYADYPVSVSWEEVFLKGTSVEVSSQRVIIAHPVLESEDMLLARQAMRQIREAAAELELTPERGVRVRITGNPALNYEEMLGLARDIGGASAFCFALVGLILYRALRSGRLVAAALLTLLTGLIWTAAFAALAVGHLNIISVSFAILFIGLGIDFAIHLGMRYADLLRGTQTHAESLRTAAAEVGASLVLCALTTSIGFYVFIPTDYRGVAELGLIAGTGMFIILFLTLTLFPALLSGWLKLDPSWRPAARLRFRPSGWRALGRHPRIVAVTALLAAIAGLAVLPNAYFDSNIIAMRDPETESVQAFNDLLAAPESAPWYINVVSPNLEQARALADRIRGLDEVERAITAADLIPADQEEKLEILADLAMLLDAPPVVASTATASPEGPGVDEQIAALRTLHEFFGTPWMMEQDSELARSVHRLRGEVGALLEKVEREDDAERALANFEEVLFASLPDQIARIRTALSASQLELKDLPAKLRSRMLAPDGRARVQIFPSQNLSERGAREAFVDAVAAASPSANGVIVNIVQFARATVSSFQQALVSAVLVIALLLLVMWRDLVDAALVMAPLLLAAVLTVASMVLLGLAFNFTNVIVIPLMFGIGVDSGIHLVHESKLRSSQRSHLLESTTARAVFYSALTTTVSFGSLGFCSHLGMRSLGIELTAGMILTVLSVLVVLPALIELRLGKKRVPHG